MSNPFNPFGGPFGNPSQDAGGNPMDDERNLIVCCPTCKSTNFRAWTNDYGVHRQCLEPNCRETWSGSTVAAAQPFYSDPVLPDGSVAPDIDIPVVQYTGASFRDPSKTFGGDDY